MSEKYKIRDQEKLYFITFAVVNWVDVFTNEEYRNVIVESLKYCQKEKGLEIYGWVIMSIHIHMAIGSEGQYKIEEIVRDFKKFTSVKIIRAIENNSRESRREWMLEVFRKEAEKSKKHLKYKFWQNEYHPVELTDNKRMENAWIIFMKILSRQV